MNKKIRKHSGRKADKIYDKEQLHLTKTYWNDWIDYRDGLRSWYEKKKKSTFRNR